METANLEELTYQVPLDAEKVKQLIHTEITKCLPKVMSEDEKMDSARSLRDIASDQQQFAEQRSEEMSGEFIRLEVQIATILFAFTSIFANSFVGKASLDIFWYKLGFALAVFSLILSLIMGLLQLKTVESFWDERLKQRNLRFHEWKKAANRETTFELAVAFEQGTRMDNGNLIFIPKWPWVMQTIFLGGGVGILFILFLAFLFTN